MHTSSSHRQRGITLIEALIAVLILALGMLAIARLQTHLRLNAEIARQRSEAVRLAQEDIEALRAFAVLAATSGVASFDAIAGASRTVDAASGYATNTAYLVTRQIDTAGALQAKNLRVTVGWTDRAGNPQQVELASVIAGIAPAHGGALGLARSAAPANPPFGRSAHIPLVAKDLGDGRSAFKPVGGGTVALVFDNASGLLTGRCTAVAPTTPTGGLSAANLGPCDANVGHLLSGVVRFASATPLEFSIAMTGSDAIAPICSVEPVTTAGGDRFVAWHCAVYPAAGGRWSGRANLVPSGWTIGTSAADHRVCRYTSDLDSSGAIDANIEHLASYADVDASLANQNFLVVAANLACPAGQAVRVTGNNGDVYVDLSTAQHQP
ncbi:MAG: prepilin-type N-terminal cleavage/methylation domain-containing protein [Pseudomonadota bacterium]